MESENDTETKVLPQKTDIKTSKDLHENKSSKGNPDANIEAKNSNNDALPIEKAETRTFEPVNYDSLQEENTYNTEDLPSEQAIELPCSPYPSDYSDYLEMDLGDAPHITDCASHILSEEEIEASLGLNDINLSSFATNLEISTKQLNWIKHHPSKFDSKTKDTKPGSPLKAKGNASEEMKSRRYKDSYRQPYKNKQPSSNHNSQPVSSPSHGHGSPQYSNSRPARLNDPDPSAKRNFPPKKNYNPPTKYDSGTRYKPTNPKNKNFKSPKPAPKRPNDKDLPLSKSKFPKKKNKHEKEKHLERNVSRTKVDFETLLQSTAQSLETESSESHRRGSYTKSKDHNT